MFVDILNYFVICTTSKGRTLCINGLPHGEGTLFRKLWAAAALADEKYHQLIVKAHMDFIEAGSQIITTNSYAVQPNYYSTAYGEDAYEGIMLEHAKVSTYHTFLKSPLFMFLFMVL